jgi:TolB protein
MNPDGSHVRKLTSLEEGSEASMASWEPADSLLAFTKQLAGAPSQLWIMNANGRNPHLLFNDGIYADMAADFSPLGDSVVFSRCQTILDGTCAVYRVKLDGTGLSEVTHFKKGVSDLGPVYSVDGRTIAFERQSVRGLPSSIYLMNADGSEVRCLTPPEMEAAHPSWSPDGSKIAFSGHSRESGNWDIWLIGRDGQNLVRLTGSDLDDYWFSPRRNMHPSWSPDGSFIVFEQSDGITPSIFTIQVEGGELQKGRATHLTEWGGKQPRWSQAP